MNAPDQAQALTQARDLIRDARIASLGTTNGHHQPFVSMVTVAASGPTTLIMLLSGLARHTQNLSASAAASLLVRESSDDSVDPMAGTRVTLSGSVRRLDRGQDEAERSAFLTAHPSAEMYADFGDFAFFEFAVDEAHLIAGFGRIETIPSASLV